MRVEPGVGQSASTSASTSITIAGTSPAGTGTPIGLIDNVVPAIASIVFDRNAPRMAVRVVFSDDIDPATLAAGDLTLQLQPAGTAVSMAGQAVAYDAATRTATFTFPAYANGVLPDGRYRAAIGAGIAADRFGNLNTGTGEVSFTVLRGDITGDGVVNFDDLVILAQNYGTAGRTFGQGNLNYDPDGRVDFDDLVVLAQNYNAALAMFATVLSRTKTRVPQIAEPPVVRI